MDVHTIKFFIHKKMQIIHDKFTAEICAKLLANICIAIRNERVFERAILLVELQETI